MPEPLEKSRIVNGIVIDEITKKPLQKAIVELHLFERTYLPLSLPKDIKLKKKLSDDNGKFKFQITTNGYYYITAMKCSNMPLNEGRVYFYGMESPDFTKLRYKELKKYDFLCKKS